MTGSLEKNFILYHSELTQNLKPQRDGRPADYKIIINKLFCSICYDFFFLFLRLEIS